MNELLIQIKKKTDGSAALSCRRADGSVTWQRLHGSQARFFPLHDLTHYAVESMLGQYRGFFSLVAEGWDLADFGRPWRQGLLPADALCIELLVGFLDRERAAGVIWSAAQVQESITTYAAEHDMRLSIAPSDADLDRIRDARSALFARWAALPPGGVLELQFAPASAAP